MHGLHPILVGMSTAHNPTDVLRLYFSDSTKVQGSAWDTNILRFESISPLALLQICPRGKSFTIPRSSSSPTDVESETGTHTPSHSYVTRAWPPSTKKHIFFAGINPLAKKQALCVVKPQDKHHKDAVKTSLYCLLQSTGLAHFPLNKEVCIVT